MMRAAKKNEAAGELLSYKLCRVEGKENAEPGLSAKDKEERAQSQATELQKGLTVAAGDRWQSLPQDQGRTALAYGGARAHSGRGRYDCATFSALGRKIGCECGNSQSNRRITAAPHFARGVFFGGYLHGLRAFDGRCRAVTRFLLSAFPHRTAPLTTVESGRGSFNLSTGA